MGRCEGYYKLENRRCDREGDRHVRAADGQLYVLCGYHRRHVWTTNVAHWHGETGLRRSAPAELQAAVPQPQPFAWA